MIIQSLQNFSNEIYKNIQWNYLARDIVLSPILGPSVFVPEKVMCCSVIDTLLAPPTNMIINRTSPKMIMYDNTQLWEWTLCETTLTRVCQTGWTPHLIILYAHNCGRWLNNMRMHHCGTLLLCTKHQGKFKTMRQSLIMIPTTERYSTDGIITVTCDRLQAKKQQHKTHTHLDGLDHKIVHRWWCTSSSSTSTSSSSNSIISSALVLCMYYVYVFQ